MQSDQERLLAIIGGRCAGREYVFAPDTWRTASGEREPADLVWVVDRCVFLFFLCGMAPQSSPPKIERARRKAIDHNVDQARGALRLWKLHRIIRGRNQYGRFEIAADDIHHTVVVSVINCTDAIAIYHHELAQKLDTTFCATIPQSTMEFLISAGASPLDFVDLLRWLSGRSGIVPEKEMLQQAEAYRDTAIAAASILPNGVVSQVTRAELNGAVSILLSARGSEPTIDDNSDEQPLVHWEIGSGRGRNLLSDVALIDIYRIAIVLDLARRQILADPTHQLFYMVRLTYYQYGIAVARSSADLVAEERTQKMLDAFQQFQTTEGTAGGNILLYDLESGTAITGLRKLSNVSWTRQFLDTCLNGRKIAGS